MNIVDIESEKTVTFHENCSNNIIKTMAFIEFQLKRNNGHIKEEDTLGSNVTIEGKMSNQVK